MRKSQSRVKHMVGRDMPLGLEALFCEQYPLSTQAFVAQLEPPPPTVRKVEERGLASKFRAPHRAGSWAAWANLECVGGPRVRSAEALLQAVGLRLARRNRAEWRQVPGWLAATLEEARPLATTGSDLMRIAP